MRKKDSKHKPVGECLWEFFQEYLIAYRSGQKLRVGDNRKGNFLARLPRCQANVQDFRRTGEVMEGVQCSLLRCKTGDIFKTLLINIHRLRLII
ncbi:MAG TPA: hypothetical protein DCZ94_08915 [Lentisphaeria bacterium]|nr:hypothetical protein [Lentisphaeria bacterium]